MIYTMILFPVLISFTLSVALCPVLIPFLKKLKFGQYVRDDGPQSHLNKQGTPTMGGILILISIIITSLCFIKGRKDLLAVLFATVGFGIIGFLDDYIKVVMKRSMGLRAWQKIVAQLAVTAIFTFYIENVLNLGTTVYLPFLERYADLHALYYPFLFLVMLGTVNGVNLTDGLDGLASSVTVLIAVFFTVVSIAVQSGVTPITCAVVGSLMGFLVYNVHPASVFMGDTGSLALGGFVAATAVVLRMPLFILIVGIIYFAEAVSDIIQVVYFKMTGGKRFFKMAPLHHHFELCGWSETKIVTVFAVITALACLVGLAAIGVF